MRKISITYSVLLAIVLLSFSSVAHDSVKLRVGLLSLERPPLNGKWELRIKGKIFSLSYQLHIPKLLFQRSAEIDSFL